MTAKDSDPTSMEDPHAPMEEEEEEEGGMANIPSSGPPTTVHSSSPLGQTTALPNSTDETVVESNAVSVADNDCSPALSSPTEAKPALAPTGAFDGTVETRLHTLTSPPVVHSTTIPSLATETVVVSKAISVVIKDFSFSLCSPTKTCPANPAKRPLNDSEKTLETSTDISHIPSSSSVVDDTTAPKSTSETVKGLEAVSVAAEASPAKSAVTPPTNLEGTVVTSPDTSHIPPFGQRSTIPNTSETLIESKAAEVKNKDYSQFSSSSMEANPAKAAPTPPSTIDRTGESTLGTSHIPSSPPVVQSTLTPDLTSETVTIESKAITMAHNDCSPAVSLLDGASQETDTVTDRTVKTSSDTSYKPPSSPAAQSTIPYSTNESAMELKAVSVANNDCCSALSSPAEASPAKPAATPPATLDRTVTTSPDTSHIASVSDSLTFTGTSLVNISEASLPTLPVMPRTTLGSGDQEADIPNALTFKGVTVTLENNSVWKQFYSCGTEMILTKQGRRMFPYCRYRLAGLDPDRLYNLVLAIVPSDRHKYRWNQSKWEIVGPAEDQPQGLIRGFTHHNSPSKGSDWMGSLVSFYKLKLTNNPQDQDGHIIIHSMQRYIPRIHVIPVPDGGVFLPDKPVVIGPESIAFTFPQTEFMAVTTYQNFRITQLKINHNPFAKSFREDGNNSRLQRVASGAHPGVKSNTQSTVLIPAEINENQEAVDLSTKNEITPTSSSTEQESRLVLKPIMSTSANKADPYVPCFRGNHALGELVLVKKHPANEDKEEPNADIATPKMHKGFRLTPNTLPRISKFKTSTPASSLGYHRRRRKRIKKRQGKMWKAGAAGPQVNCSPSLNVAMQPELDDVEGLLFVSFTSKEALEVHARDKPSHSSSFASTVSQNTSAEWKQTMEEDIRESDEEKIQRLEADLLQNLTTFKHRQVIHPVLQEVGLKLSSLDPAKPIDLKYLGVLLPLPPPVLPKQDKTAQGGLSFISRTGKTNDMTKIKGWRNKFIKNKDTLPSNCDGSQKNLSAFCSNMLDEYLESEAQYISERADAFSTNPEGSVSYQLPATSSSYVKTLDSVLKRQNTTSKFLGQIKMPGPLSRKSARHSASTASSIQTTDAAGCLDPVSQKDTRQKPSRTQRPPGITKSQFSLMRMELGALSEGLQRTQLTQDRVSLALSAILTKQMRSSQILKTPKHPQYRRRPECGQDFCILGCVCLSLQQLNLGPFHCGKPQCMFDCTCFKRKITKQASEGETDQQSESVYSMTSMGHMVQPRFGSHSKKLWRRDLRDVDVDPVTTPKISPLWTTQAKIQRRSMVQHPVPQIREEDKSPVYKYFESMMTCARVRVFTRKPPQDRKVPNPDIPTTEDTTTNNQQKNKLSSVLTKTEGSFWTSKSAGSGAQMKIEIQSACTWHQDRKMILETLYRRMTQNQLSRRFCIGPYRINPLAKISLRKQSSSVITYRVHISKPPKASDNNEDESDDSNEENRVDPNLPENVQAELEKILFERQEVPCGVTPFLSGLMPAGKLSARTKPVGFKAEGLIQVNGKSYNQARLLLGNMGSLHPANRLAAYCTGRLKVPANMKLKNLQKSSEPTNNTSPPAGLHIKAAGTVVPPVITATKTTDLKTQAQTPVQKLLQPEPLKKGPITLIQLSLNPVSAKPSSSSPPSAKPFSVSEPSPVNLSSAIPLSASTFSIDPSSATPSSVNPSSTNPSANLSPTNPSPANPFSINPSSAKLFSVSPSSTNLSSINSVQSFIKSQLSSLSPPQSNSASSPVSLTVSPALKTPSFLGQSGTYSFRICPPANQATTGKNLPVVSLPGGFTLIQLPKQAGDSVTQQPQPVNTTNKAGINTAPPQKPGLLNNGNTESKTKAKWHEFDIFARAKELSDIRSTRPGTFTKQVFDEKMRAITNETLNTRRVEMDLDNISDELSSDYSDFDIDEDDDDDPLDIETVEDVHQGMAIAKMKEAVRMALLDARDSSGFGLISKLAMSQLEEQIDEGSHDNKRKKKHSVLERRRRSELRDLFDKLITILKTDPKTPRLRLLSLAADEVQNLVEVSDCLEEQKRKLAEEQSVLLMKLSELSGKPQELIKNKLNEIYKKQIERENAEKLRPFFSNLLRSRAFLLEGMKEPNASLLKGMSPQPLPQQPVPLLEAFADRPHLHPLVSAAINSISMKPTPRPLYGPLAVFSDAMLKFNSPSPSAEKQPEDPEEPNKDRQPQTVGQQEMICKEKMASSTPKPPAEPQPKLPVVTALPQVITAPVGALPVLSPTTASKPPEGSLKPVPLPLIRSKNGRIILPASLKPIGQGFYTLTFMKPTQDGKEGEPSDQDSSTNKDKNPPEVPTIRIVEQVFESESSSKPAAAPAPTVKPASTVKLVPAVAPAPTVKPVPAVTPASAVAPTPAAGSAPTVAPAPTVVPKDDCVILTKPVFVPLMDLKTLKGVNINGTLGAARLSFQQVQQALPALHAPPLATEPKPVSDQPSPAPVARRGRGRPRKHPLPLLSGQSGSETSQAADSSPPSKRGRGRPKKDQSKDKRKDESIQMWKPPPNLLRSTPLRYAEDSPGRLSDGGSDAETPVQGQRSTTRPLTRGALGKDFPSAKRRSWIDVEKELDLDQIESE